MSWSLSLYRSEFCIVERQEGAGERARKVASAGIQTFNSKGNSNTDAGSRRLPPFSLAPLHLPSAQRCRTPICKETMTNSFEMIFDRPAIKSFYVLRFQKINLTSCTVWTTNFFTFQILFTITAHTFL